MNYTDARQAAEKTLDALNTLVGTVTGHLKKVSTGEDGKVSVGKMDQHQLVAFELAYLATEANASRFGLEYLTSLRENGGGDDLSLEDRLVFTFVAESALQASDRLSARCQSFGVAHEDLMKVLWNPDVWTFVMHFVAPERYSEIFQLVQEKGHTGDYHLPEDLMAVRAEFKRFAEENVAPLAEHHHRHDADIPEEIITSLAELGCFGLSIPSEYDGMLDDLGNIGMCLVTEELSRGSLGLAGSLITRPEILAKAILKGGTDEQKQHWLPKLASGEVLPTVAVTEPDFGSDVAGMKVTATEEADGWRLNGVKTWCTFAGRADLMLVLARTNPDPALKHRGLSMFVAPKPRFTGHAFEYEYPDGKGRIEGRAIPTIGYRGMHSFEVALQNVWVPKENLIGGEAGKGNGFYLQMEGFAGGRLQTAARAIGVMQAAYEVANRYSSERKVFGKPIAAYGLSQYKLARMAMILCVARQFTYGVCRLIDQHKGQMEASMVKLYCSRIAEWVAREAMQLHGGMGYAEEYAVSRYYVDARVFSIFEGAEEVLALRVIARGLVDKA